METIKYGRGKHPNSRKKRNHSINDHVFSTYNEDSCYWAGFIAADGNITQDKKKLTIVLKRSDGGHLRKFLRWADSNYNVCETLSHGYPIASTHITSEQICKDLLDNFNITPAKSLTLKPPPIYTESLIDCYIKGYIDGDGTVGLTKGKRQKRVYISIIGTKPILQWIGKRLGGLLNQEEVTIYKNGEKRCYTIVLSDRKARTIVTHFFHLNCPYLERKWTSKLYDACINFRKYRNMERYEEVLKMSQNGLNQTQIGAKLGVTSAAISWFQKQDVYKELQRESQP